MPETYDNEMKGVLFRQAKKDNDKQPDYWGRAEVNGEKLRLAGWLRKSSNGNPYISIAISKAQQDASSKEVDAFLDEQQAAIT